MSMQESELITQEVRENVEKESHSPSLVEGESISKQLVSSSKKGWG